MTAIQLQSETDPLEGVILHPPGPEVEHMTPGNAERALYSDILNLDVARREYAQLEQVLEHLVPTRRIQDLLTGILRSEQIKENLVKKACYQEGKQKLIDSLLDLAPEELARQLIQGVPRTRNSLSSYLSDEHFAMHPLHNFFFTRDASVAIGNQVLISRMANQVREREALIMQAIFAYHPDFRATTFSPGADEGSPDIHYEGGDILVAAENITLVGLGSRTSVRGIDQLASSLGSGSKTHHLLIQELPSRPESFIHLDMCFTLLDRDSCMVYEPLILKRNIHRTLRMDIEAGKISSITEVENLVEGLKDLGMDLKPSFCGGQKDPMTQEREQWHSGANFFALGPGKLIGYNRNVHTLESLNQDGYEIIAAREVLEGSRDPGDYKRYVLTIDGAELSRGGGGVRCMTMPYKRSKTN